MRSKIRNLFFLFLSRFHIVKCEFRRNRNRDASIELQPLGAGKTRIATATGTTTTPTTTVINNEELQEHLLPDNMTSAPSVPTGSSGMYSYTYDHMIDRIVAFFSIHLRHRQDLYSLSRPSSVPPTQAPYPPGHTPPSSSVLPHSSQQGGNPSNLQCSRSGDDIEEAGQTLPHVSTSPQLVQMIESSFYDEIIDNELANDYSDVAEVWME